jgi:hypothetical protein
MEIVVKVGIARKIGQPDYGSYQASCHIDCPANIALIGNPDELEALIAQLYTTCVESVNAQLALAKPAPVVQSPVPQPEPEKPKSSVFGQWLKGKAIAYGVDMPVLTGLLYRQIIGNEAGPLSWTDQGKELAEVWKSKWRTNGDHEKFFDDHLVAALESLNDPS